MTAVGWALLGAVTPWAPVAAQAARGPGSPHAVRTEAEVVTAVREANLALRAARTGAAAAAERPGQVRWPFPMLEVMPMPAMIADGEAGVQVMARQPIPWPARLSADRTARARLADVTSLEAEALDLELVLVARMTYAELWGVQEQVARIQDYIGRLATFREAALAQYAAGRGPQQAVLGIQVEAEMLAQRLEGLAEERSALAARIEGLTGGAVRLVADDPLAPPPALASPSAPSPARAGRYAAEVAGHPRVEAGRAMQEAESAMADMTRTMLRPDFTFGVNVNLSRPALDRMFGQEPVMPAVGIMVPLWRGGVRAQVREAELRAEQRELETADVRLALESELGDVLERLARVRDRIARYEDRLRPQVRQTLEVGLAGYQAGTTRFLELLDAQRMALDVEVDLIMARVQEAGLVARLDAVTGQVPRYGE